MATNTVTISGMFGNDKTYFADSPVVIEISGLEWPPSSPFNIVRIYVVYNDEDIGDFHGETGRQSSVRFDISSALRAIWSEYDFTAEVAKAKAALSGDTPHSQLRSMRAYSLRIYTEYLSSDGVFTQAQCIDSQGRNLIPGGQCLIGGYTEWERSLIDDPADADVSHLEHTGVRNGDASTKPTSSPEKVGINSITSWVDVQEGYTKSIFYPADAITEPDDIAGRTQGWTGHTPIVLRDSQPYVDFLFINRRGAIETCSGMMKESMSIDTDVKQYSRIERPTFKPSRSLMAIGTDGRRSWQMSSGYVTREWAEWWVNEFLAGKRKQWWMLWKGPGMSSPRYVPVTIKPAKNNTSIYDRQKQQMPSVEFTVTLALEG